MIFTYENQGSNTYLVYKVKETDTVDTMSLGMLANNRITGLVPAILQQLDNDRFIKYNVSARVSVKQFFSGPVKKNGLLKVFKGMADALLSAEEYMIDPHSILLDLDYIYTDVSTYDTQLICLPIMHNFQMDVDLKLLFQQIVFNTQFDQTENCDYVAQLINYLNSAPVFSLSDFRMVLNTISGPGGMVQTEETPEIKEKPLEPVLSGSSPVQSAMPGSSVPNSQVPASGLQNSGQQPLGTSFQKVQNAGENSQMWQSMDSNPQMRHSAEAGSQIWQNAGAVSQTWPGAGSNLQAQQNAAVYPQMQQNAGRSQQMQPVVGQNARMQQEASKNSKQQVSVQSASRQKMPQQTPAAQAGNPEEKQMSVFYLLQHYNKENAAIYKSQKQAKKAAASKPSKSAKSVPQNQNLGFQIPGQEPQTLGFNAAQQMPSQPGFREQGAAAMQTQSSAVQPIAYQTDTRMPEQPNGYPASQQTVQLQSNILQAKPLNFGETTVLNAGKKGETTVLNAAPMESTPVPHLVRIKSNEKIELNKPVFRIGKEKSYVDYFIGDNTAISRSHANVVTREGKFFLVDTNSTNHTYINGIMIQSNVETEIVHGSVIRLANEEFEFRVY